MTGAPLPTLSLVLPALNEEQAVATTLARAVDALATLERDGEILCGEVILVDDGSDDSTLERARSVDGVRIVTYPSNRGYGRAIEAGFAAAEGELLAFMDADGTCDPEALGALLEVLRKRDADVVLGSRLHAASRMPRLRRLGNRAYAWLLSIMSGTRIRDSASGMRLLRREVLQRLQPLPGGLSYTPAMTAKCVMDPLIRICEVEMPYGDRLGRSKLNVLGDGVRFLHTILVTGMFYSPLRVLAGGGLAAATALLLVGAAARSLGLGAGWSGSPLSLLALSVAGLAGGVALTFHFFSQRILPGWPSLAAERWIEAALRAPRALALAALCAGGALAVLSLDAVRSALRVELVVVFALLQAAGYLVFVAAGRVIAREMGKYDVREPPVDHLRGTREYQGGAASSGDERAPSRAEAETVASARDSGR